jgi:magnesium chelatase family protein
MVARAYTVAFHGVEARLVEVQCSLAPGMPAFNIVGLPDKAVSEARERVRAAMSSMALALPSKRITINLSPADMPKEGSHFDLPIALALMAAMGVIPQDEVACQVSLGELSLDGKLIAVVGTLPAALAAAEAGFNLICPADCGPEAAWVGAVQVIAPNSLLECMNHFRGRAVLAPAQPGEVICDPQTRDLRDVKGQERAKRALEIAAAGRHHLFFVGSPGSGKSMMAARVPGLLPPLEAEEALETSMIHYCLLVAFPKHGLFAIPITPLQWRPSLAAVAGQNPAKSLWRTMAFYFWTNCPNFPVKFWKLYANPLKLGPLWLRGPTTT